MYEMAGGEKFSPTLLVEESWDPFIRVALPLAIGSLGRGVMHARSSSSAARLASSRRARAAGCGNEPKLIFAARERIN